MVLVRSYSRKAGRILAKRERFTRPAAGPRQSQEQRIVARAELAGGREQARQLLGREGPDGLLAKRTLGGGRELRGGVLLACALQRRSLDESTLVFPTGSSQQTAGDSERIAPQEKIPSDVAQEYTSLSLEREGK